jgi:predicted hotdog family 3-hydroxylacyl-ACP dehydratase
VNYDRAWIASRIPHQGSMCLLDEVVSWGEEKVICEATSHMAASNPLRSHDRLGAVAGIEYAAQAMAIHGALLAKDQVADSPRAGFLASVRSVNLNAGRLDDIQEALVIEVTCIHSEANSILYQFSVGGKLTGHVFLDGRAAVILDATLAAPGFIRGKY